MLKTVEKLNDECLGNVSGGKATVGDVVCGAALGVSGVWALAALVGLGCEMVAMVYGSKSSGALVEEEWDKAKKYSEKASKWADRGADIATLGLTAAIRKHGNS